MKTTRQRLTEARRHAADWAAKLPEAAHYHDWRNNVARPFKKAAPAGRWSNDKPTNHAGRAYYVDSLDALGWRNLGDAADILRAAGCWRSAEQCNWYADHYQGAIIKSAVLQLPARDGRAHYTPVTYCADWDGATCYPLDWYDNAEEAAHAAASYAECEAEQSRDYHARDQAEQDIEAARAEIHRINARALELAREIKQQGRAFSPAICSALRDRLTDYLTDRREQFQVIAARQADYLSAVQW